LLIKDLYFALYPLSSNALTQIKINGFRASTNSRCSRSRLPRSGFLNVKHCSQMVADTIYRISVTLNLTFKRVPAAGSRSEWKTAIDAIPDDSDAADTRARELDPAVSNS
jgi:hypothetical protein